MPYIALRDFEITIFSTLTIRLFNYMGVSPDHPPEGG